MTTTTVDKTLAINTALLSMFFIIPVFFLKNAISYMLLIFGVTLIIMALWKLEYFKYDNKKIERYNFLGLIKREYWFNDLLSYESKRMNVKSENALLFVKNENRYLIFSILKVKFRNGKKLRVDQRTMSIQNFKKLKEILKEKQH